MLIIKGTLQLNSLRPMAMGSDILSQKLLGNYQMMGLDIQTQDLLHMTMLPTEIYVEQGGEPYTVINQTVEVNNSAKIEMVNSFLNRIMLLDTGEFTYQDEVYISNFLQKLGITNVQEFMDVTRKQLVQNQQLTMLLKKYWESGRDVYAIVEKKEQLESYENTTTVEQEKVADTRYYLQNEVFNRLQTILLNNHIYENQKYLSNTANQITNQEFLLSEQIQMADEIQLIEMKSKVYRDKTPATYQQYYHYEQIPLVEEQLNEQTILKYLSVAILNNMVNKMSYVRLQDNEILLNQWIHYDKAFYGSSENTILRFEDFHEQQYQGIYNSDAYVESMNQLYGDELTVLNFLEMTEENVVDEQSSFWLVNMLQQIQNREKQATEIILKGKKEFVYKAGETDVEIIESLKKEENRLYISWKNIEQKIYQNESRLNEYIQKADTVYEIENNDIAKQWIENKEELHRVKQNQINKLGEFRNIENNTKYQDITNLSETDINQAKIIHADDYRYYLEQINERNLQMNQKLEQLEVIEPTETTIVIDRKSAMKKSLEVLEHSNQSIEEILNYGTPIEERKNPQIERILSVADEPVRRLYEKILNYENMEQVNPKDIEAAFDIFETRKITDIINDVERSQFHTTKEQQVEELIYVQNTERIGNRNHQTEDVLQTEAAGGRKGHEVEIEYTHSEKSLQLQEQLKEHIKVLQNRIETKTKEKIEQIEKQTSEIIVQLEQTVLEPKSIDVSVQSEVVQGRELLHTEKTESLLKTEIYSLNKSQSLQKEQTVEHISLVHRKAEQLLESEEIDELLQNKKTTVKQQQNQIDLTEHITVLENKIQETKQELIVQNRKSITEIIQQNLQSQMNTISEQVYQNLEHRLWNERKRRGF